MKKSRGFTLVEVVIAITIIGILASIALPAYNESVNKTRRADGQSALLQAANAMERYYSEQSPFTYAGAALGVGGIYPAEAPLDGNVKYYNLSVSASNASAFTLRATPINGQVGDGFLTLNQAAQRSWDRDNSGIVGADEACWRDAC